jgi:hypothetical protein
VIPTLAELARNLGVSAALGPIAFVVALTGILFLLQTVFRWFGDRKS